MLGEEANSQNEQKVDYQHNYIHSAQDLASRGGGIQQELFEVGRLQPIGDHIVPSESSTCSQRNLFTLMWLESILESEGLGKGGGEQGGGKGGGGGGSRCSEGSDKECGRDWG
ncbi:hypothetical protein EYF80_023627 [Liparis tanakae]|uniref:Uncharacterized protein n=1 Tax=Liparis tanakae TaxID=230148 RepID=A0A4Z2HJS4_9TELE|nr:hypothetical protein EYF80_023627 [Liparis tanakae]